MQRALMRHPAACTSTQTAAAHRSRSMARAALLTASQCATYDELKVLFMRNLGWEDNLQTHFAGERGA